MLLRSSISGFLVFALAVIAAAQERQSTPDVNTIVARMMNSRQENKAREHAYTVKRDYQLMDKQSEPRAQVIANITYLPPDQKQYQIESSTGGMGGKVLRDIVAKESEPSKEPHRKEISPENYDFQLLGEETLNGRRCYVLAVNPKREEKELIKGRLWVDAANYNIHQIEGNPARSPSWWVRDLHLLMNFALVNGMWLHTSTYAVADIRFKGKYVLESHSREYRSVEQTALKPHRNPGILAGAAINP